MAPSPTDRLTLPSDSDLSEGLDPTAALVQVGERLIPLARFLSSCATATASRPNGGGDDGAHELYEACQTFVRAGLQALAARSTADDWLQIGVGVPTEPDARCEFYRRVAELVRKLLSESAIDNFFFMHKPPGVRLRFEIGPKSPASLGERLHETLEHWKEEGLVLAIEPGIYEPESQLFGGTASMAYVHALFTIDSLVWLDYHARPAGDNDHADVAWLVSLAMLPAVFQGLDITGWEDMGVWHYLGQRAGRDLDQGALSLAEYDEIATSVRAIWLRRELLLEQLPADLHSIVSDHYPGLQAAAAQWRSGYFATTAAALGPRSAVAFYVIFHWNRAGLSAVQQALLTASLSRPEI